MITRVIEGGNVNFGVPPDWDETTHGPCNVLPVRVTFDEEKRPAYCESAWEPTPAEMIFLSQGGSIILRVYGYQPPVSLTVDMPEMPEMIETGPSLERAAFQRGIEAAAEWYRKQGRKLHPDEVPDAIKSLVFVA